MYEIAEILREKGLKATPQRMAIYSVLINTKSHPSAETIFKTLEPKNPSMSLATVYKTLEAFKKAGLITEINLGDGFSRYDGVTQFHPHVICTECGRLIDAKLKNIELIIEDIENSTNFKIQNEQMFFYGICSKCQKQKNAKVPPYF